MPRIGLTISDDMSEKLNEAIEQTHIPQAEFVRLAIKEKLEKLGIKADATVERGGYRERKSQDEG